jgi:DNA-binding transcriptional ArsR family regulator
VNLEPEKRERTTTGLPQDAGLAILRAIGHGRRSVGEIVAMTRLAQSNVSNHLARFRRWNWVQVHRRGREAYYAISDAALLAFIERFERSGRDRATPEQEEAIRQGVERYRRAAMLGRDDLGEGAIDELLDAAVPWQTIYLRVLTPALRQVGDLREQGELAIATEHAATAFTQRIMHRLAPRLRLSAGDPLGTLVVACLEGDPHALGAEMAADFFQAAGWQVHYLGPNAPGRS